MPYCETNPIIWIVNNRYQVWFSGAIWPHSFASILAQAMACCLTAPSHYLNQYWLIINGFCGIQTRVISHGRTHDINAQDGCKNHTFEITAVSARGQWVNTMRPRQNGCHFADIFSCIFFNEIYISINVLLKFDHKTHNNNIAELVHTMAWQAITWTNGVYWLTHIWVTRPQWVNGICCTRWTCNVTICFGINPSFRHTVLIQSIKHERAWRV